MEMTMTRLQEILSEAFDSGYKTFAWSGEGSTRDEMVASILDRYQIKEADDKPPPKDDGTERLYTTAELREMPVGTVFLHSQLGKCRIRKRNTEKYMVFDNAGLHPAGFAVDGFPWEMPMKKLNEGEVNG